MRIGINALYLTPNKVGGTETYLRNLIRELILIDQNNQYILFTNKECAHTFDPLPSHWNEIICELSPQWKPFRVFWEQVKLPELSQKYKIDLLHSPAYISPLSGNFAKVVTLFDMHYHYYPETFTLAKRLYWNHYIPKSANQVDKIITLSNYSKKDICNILHIPESKVHVTPASASENYVQMRTADEIHTFLDSRHLKQPYLLCMATFNRHKNLVGVVCAFSKMKKLYSCPHHLVLGGIKTNYYPTVLKEIEKSDYKQDIHVLDYLPEQQLPLLYQGADLFVLLSYFEGFGLPVLEAMAGGTPVLCSNRTSLPEVVGDAAVLVDPDDESSIVNAIIDLLKNPEKRKSLGAKGRERANAFSWKTMAELTLSAYQEAYEIWKHKK
jgi:glycosyltransferase involved in cell wall biosynthesis